jgi:hypothetical protein
LKTIFQKYSSLSFLSKTKIARHEHIFFHSLTLTNTQQNHNTQQEQKQQLSKPGNVISLLQNNKNPKNQYNYTPFS